MIIAGKDKGKSGKVLKIYSGNKRVVVEHINIVKKARRKTRQDDQGGLIEIEMPIHASNVMLKDKKTNKPTRFGASILKDGSKVRLSKRSSEVV